MKIIEKFKEILKKPKYSIHPIAIKEGEIVARWKKDKRTGKIKIQIPIIELNLLKQKRDLIFAQSDVINTLSFYLDEWKEVRHLLDEKSRKIVEEKIIKGLGRS
jgi:hypothetical protein